jgi:ketosteroid isomerase-like protein
MYSWLVSKLVRRAFNRLSAGDPSVVLATFGKGARFVFPGSSSWAIDTTDRSEIEAWFKRFAALRPSFTIRDVMVKGPPWNTRVRTRGADRIELGSGHLYTNEWVQCARVAWGKLRDDTLYLDTEKVVALDVALGNVGD